MNEKGMNLTKTEQALSNPHIGLSWDANDEEINLFQLEASIIEMVLVFTINDLKKKRVKFFYDR
jgi:stress response protein SCP2